MAEFNANSSVELYFDDSKKLETTGYGITVTGDVNTSNNISIAGVSTFAGAIDANGSLDVDGHTELDNLNVSGVSTFAGAIDANGSLDVDGHTELDNVNVSGVSTFTGAIDANGSLDVDGHTELDNVNVSGVSTFAGSIDANGSLDVDGHTELDDLNVSGVSTFASAIVGSAVTISSSGINAATGIITASSLDAAISEWVLGADGTDNYTFSGPGFTGAENDPTIYVVRGQKYNFENKMGAHPFRIQSDPNGSTGTQYNDGITNNDVSNGTLVWDVQFDAPEILYYQCTSHANMGGRIYTRSDAEDSISFETIIVGGGTTITGSGINAPTGIITASTFSGSGASLTSIPNGALTNSSIAIGGVTVSLGGTDATPAFDLSDATDYPYTSLTGITTEILGDTTPQLGGNLDLNSKFITGTGGINVSGVVTATTFSGSGASLTNIPNGALTNSSIAIGGVTVSLGGTDATPAFDLSDATAYPYTSLTGITTEILGDTTPQLGGNLDLNSKFITGTGGVNVTGVVTATSFVGNVTGVASTATKLATARTFELTGDVVASQISFDGTGNVSLAATIQPNSVALGGDTTGDYVESISGTGNQITVSSGTGEGSTPVISIPNNPTLPGTTVTVTTDLQVNRNLNVTGNVTIGGTSATLFTETLKISDPDIIVGFRTDAGGNDISNDTTASHGGIAVASTEGSPIVSFVGGGGTVPVTYKKIFWFESGAFTGLATDAWLTNYAFGVGTTSMSAGTKFAVGNIETDFDDIKSVRHINSSGVVTATTFSGSGASLTSIPNGALTNNSVNYGGVTVSLGGTDATPAFDLSDATAYPYTSLTGITTEIVGDTTPQLGGNLDLNSKFITGTGGVNVTGVVTATSFSGSGASLTGITAASIGALSGLTIREEGSVAGSASSVGDINFVSSNLTATASGIGATVTLSDTPTFTSTVIGTGVTINSSGINATGVITATSFSGSGANLTNIPAPDVVTGDKYNTGITTSIYVSITGGIGTAVSGLTTVAANNDIFIGPGIGYSFPSTAGKSYIIESIHVTNIYNTHLYLTSRHDFNGGENVPTAQRVIVPYQGALEVLEEPIIAKPSDILRFQAFAGIGETSGVGPEAVGVNNGLDSFITYSEKTDTNFIGTGKTVVTPAGTELFTSNTNPSVIQSIRLCNYDLDFDVDASVSIYRGGSVGGILTTGVRQGYLVYNLTVPKNSVIEILERPKYLAANDTVVVGIAGTTLTNSLSSTLSGKYIT
jgi:hypothetical protein